MDNFMNIKTASAFRSDLYNTISATYNGEPLVITSKKGNCVLVSENDWNAIQGTLQLLNNPKIRNDIITGIATDINDCSDSLPW